MLVFLFFVSAMAIQGVYLSLLYVIFTPQNFLFCSNFLEQLESNKINGGVKNTKKIVIVC